MGEWIAVPPDIEGWHEQGFDIWDTDENTVVARDADGKHADLIAAAPELLEACVAAKTALEQIEGFNFPLIQNRLNAAIDKAAS